MQLIDSAHVRQCHKSCTQSSETKLSNASATTPKYTGRRYSYNNNNNGLRTVSLQCSYTLVKPFKVFDLYFCTDSVLKLKVSMVGTVTFFVKF